MTNTGAYIHRGVKTHTSPPRDQSKRLAWVAEPAPFGRSSERFIPTDYYSSDLKPGQAPPLATPSGQGPPHVVYRDVMQPPRWNTKGWTGLDDVIKAGRGTSVGRRGTSGMVAPSGPPRYGSSLQPMTLPVANEQRLQELLALQRRRLQDMPGPGTYQVAKWKPMREHFRRAHDPNVDGPFIIGDDETPTRMKEIARTIRNMADSGLGPGEYDAHQAKDSLSRGSPSLPIGTSGRDGRTPQVSTLSISRSIQHGIDWHVPVIVQHRPPSSAAAETDDTTRSTSAPGGLNTHSPRSLVGPSGPPTDRGVSPIAPATPPGAPSLPHDVGRAGANGLAPPGVGSSTLPWLPAELAQALSPTSGGSPQHHNSGHNGGGASPPRSAAAALFDVVSQPPPPPSSVARAVRREVAHAPGFWDWDRLGSNYRHNWTTLHGGAYSQGERQAGRLMRELQSAPPGAAGGAIPPMAQHQHSTAQHQAMISPISIQAQHAHAYGAAGNVAGLQAGAETGGVGAGSGVVDGAGAGGTELPVAGELAMVPIPEEKSLTIVLRSSQQQGEGHAGGQTSPLSPATVLPAGALQYQQYAIAYSAGQHYHQQYGGEQHQEDVAGALEAAAATGPPLSVRLAASPQSPHTQLNPRTVQAAAAMVSEQEYERRLAAAHKAQQVQHVAARLAEWNSRMGAGKPLRVISR